MATARVTAHTDAVALFSAPKVKKAKITAIDIDNQSAADRTVRLQDIFTPDDSVGATGSEETKERFQATVGVGVSFSADEPSLKDLEVLGDAKAIADDISTDCVIIVKYHFL
ncbi:unnamed protein product [marine sediment metagenome]|uniref:Uncharacterized protein n=1 Tax=marine sediment metagenome TaxID=412755 RepID=X1SNQ3_9ZZZZ